MELIRAAWMQKVDSSSPSVNFHPTGAQYEAVLASMGSRHTEAHRTSMQQLNENTHARAQAHARAFRLTLPR